MYKKTLTALFILFLLPVYSTIGELKFQFLNGYTDKEQRVIEDITMQAIQQNSEAAALLKNALKGGDITIYYEASLPGGAEGNWMSVGRQIGIATDKFTAALIVRNENVRARYLSTLIFELGNACNEELNSFTISLKSLDGPSFKDRTEYAMAKEKREYLTHEIVKMANRQLAATFQSQDAREHFITEDVIFAELLRAQVTPATPHGESHFASYKDEYERLPVGSTYKKYAEGLSGDIKNRYLSIISEYQSLEAKIVLESSKELDFSTIQGMKSYHKSLLTLRKELQAYEQRAIELANDLQVLGYFNANMLPSYREAIDIYGALTGKYQDFFNQHNI